jgi:hypothetical protein
MAHSNFFEKNASESNFQSKYATAIKLIQQNESLVAKKVLEIIKSGKLEIRSFHELSKKHYSEMRNDFQEEHDINLPKTFPPTADAVRKIESKLEGIIYNNKTIYITSQKSAKEIASTIIHEVGHFLNNSLCEQQSKKNFNIARYSDEVRAFTAEKMFERNGHCLLRSDIRAIHDKVSSLYPEFVDSVEQVKGLGYIFATYDMPDEGAMDLSP